MDRFPEKIICIGYHPSGIKSNPPNIYWDLMYAPTLEIDQKNFKKRNKNKVLLALGGTQDASLINIILEVLNQVNMFEQIDILLSPVNKNIYRENINRSLKTPDCREEIENRLHKRHKRIEETQKKLDLDIIT